LTDCNIGSPITAIRRFLFFMRSNAFCLAGIIGL
jgi:hypothetical protein